MKSGLWKGLVVSSLIAFGVVSQIECSKLYNEVQTLQKEVTHYSMTFNSYAVMLKERQMLIDSLSYQLNAAKTELESLEGPLALLDEYIRADEEEKARKAMKKEVTFNASDLRVLSNATVEDLEYALDGTKLKHLASSYIKVEEDYGWNALAVAALTAHESFWGQDYKATTLSNIGGVRLGNGAYRSFSSQQACVDYIGDLINRRYLNPEDSYFNGYALRDVNVKYCPTGGYAWAESITSIATGLMNEINSRGEY